MAENTELNIPQLSELVRLYQQQQNEKQQQLNSEPIQQQTQEPFDEEGLDETSAASQTYDVEMFINEMPNFPAIWNTSMRSYHDQNIKKTFGFTFFNELVSFFERADTLTLLLLSSNFEATTFFVSDSPFLFCFL